MPHQFVLNSVCGVKDFSKLFAVSEGMENSEDSNFDYAHDDQPDAEFKEEFLPPASENESG